MSTERENKFYFVLALLGLHGYDIFILWAVELRSVFKAQGISQEKYNGRQKDRGREATQKIDTFPTGAQWTGARTRPEDSRRETPQAIQTVMRAVPAKARRI